MKDKILNLYKHKLSGVQIAKRLGITKQYVSLVLIHDFNIRLQNKHKKPCPYCKNQWFTFIDKHITKYHKT